MKSVSVDKNKCVACGACLSCTEYFYDGEDGKACTYKSKLIIDDHLALIEELILLCPVNAILLLENSKRTSIDKVFKDLRKDLLDCLVKYRSFSEFKYERDKYKLEHPITPNYFGSDYVYSSYSKAQNAGLEEFDRYVYSQHRKILVELFVQYKMDKIYSFYDLSKNSMINNLLKKIENIFDHYSGDINAHYKQNLIPPDFGKLSINFDDDMIKSDYKSLSEFENRSTCSGVWADFKSGSYSSLSSYKTYIDYDDFEQYVGSGLFGDKYKTFYCHRGLSEVISEFHRDIQLSMSSVDLDDSAVHCVNLFIRALNSTIIKMINNKIIELERLINYKTNSFDDIKEACKRKTWPSEIFESITGKL